MLDLVDKYSEMKQFIEILQQIIGHSICIKISGTEVVLEDQLKVDNKQYMWIYNKATFPDKRFIDFLTLSLTRIIDRRED